MKTKEKEGINIEIKEGTFEDLKELLSNLMMDDVEQKKDFKLFDKIANLFDKQTLDGQRATIECLVRKYGENIKEKCCKCDKRGKQEELKEDAND